MYGEALHDYEVSLSEGVYTVAVGVMADDPKQVIFKFARVLWFEFCCILQLEEDYKHTVTSTR